jgi:hypothetical protein
MPPADASPAGPAIERARELVALAAGQGLLLRVLGGAAVALRTAPHTPAALRRECNDLDLAVEEGAGRRTGEILRGAGLRPLSERFNTLHGHRRMVFLDGDGPPLKVDVFVGDLEMCHTVPLRGRLEHDPLTLCPTDLLLSKCQIARLTAKDRLDVYCLLWNHPVASTSGDGAVDAGYIATLCARDWGWWRTATANLADCRRLLGETPLAEADRTRIGERLEGIERAVERAPKSLRWRARAKVGDRVRWFELPEDVEGPAVPPAEGTPAGGSAATSPVPPTEDVNPASTGASDAG